MTTSHTLHRADATSSFTTITTSGASGRDGSPRSAVDRVADFYGAYIDVLYDSARGQLANSLRGHFLTSGLRYDLARWEAVHHRDGVLRANGVPIAWKVVYSDSGMGHCRSRVTLALQDSASGVRRTHLLIQSDLATRLISDIRVAE